MAALYSSFYRASAPNLNNLFATILVFLVVIYLQGFRIDFSLANKQVRGYV